MGHKKYYLQSFGLAVLLSPAIMNLAIFANFIFALILPVLAGIVFIWVLFIRKNDLPIPEWSKYLPPTAAFTFYMLFWVINFGAGGYRLDSPQMDNAYLFSYMFFFYLICSALTDTLIFYPVILICLYGSIMAAITYSSIKYNRQARKSISALIPIAIYFCLSAVSVYQLMERDLFLVPDAPDKPRIESEIDTYQYRPHTENSLLNSLDEKPDFTINSNYPRLDGATAVFPVYAAMAEFLYEGLDDKTVKSYVNCSKTKRAYEKLLRGEVDLIFAAQPSKQHLEAAEEKGLELKLNSIAREAFVFFVNKENPIDNLSLEQIRSIYQKKITDWQQVGGLNEKIMPFQRPENSGSQTTMLAEVMKGEPVAKPLFEEYAGDMGGIISQVAAYRNYSSAIGYSFRFFAAGMKPNEHIKLIAIDGVAPTVENIRSGLYPFIVDVYAVTTGRESENTKKILNWLQSEQGKRLIELNGYVTE